MKIETQQRHECRYRAICDAAHLPLDLSSYEAKQFPEPFSYTFYFARDDGTFPEGFAFRIRLYSINQLKSDQVTVLDTSAPCFLEIKHPIEGQPGARRKLRAPMTVREAIQIASSKQAVLDTFGNDVPEDTMKRIEQLYEDPSHPIIPVCGVTYERRHFEKPDQRLTVDANITPFSVVKYDGVYFLHTSHDEPYSVMEVKRDGDGGEANISKFKLAAPQFKGATHIEPGMNMKAEGDWVLEERELKIDTVADPRDDLKELASSDDLSVGPWKEGASLMQFLRVGKNGICIMGREGVTAKMAIKYKTDGIDQDGVLTRTEHVIPYLTEELQRIITLLGGDPVNFERTAYFTRNRAMRLVVCKRTGNVFAVTADRCVSEDGRPDLFQTEIEYRGRITGISEQEIDETSVQSDFREVSLFVYRAFRKARLVPMVSDITKYKWISGEHAKSPSQGTETNQGFNAVVSIDRDRGMVIKEYDLWGAAIPAEQVVKNYEAFRLALSAFLQLPEARISLQTDTKFVVEETFVEGRSAHDVLRDGNAEDAINFMQTVMRAFRGQIEIGRVIDCGEGRISQCPLRTPVDLVPKNFIVTPDGNIMFIDPYPPLNREKDGSIVDTYHDNRGQHHAWVYGEASVLFTRFLMRCIKANPDLADVMAETMMKMAIELDPSGLLVSEMKVNATREKTIEDFSQIPNGLKSLLRIISYFEY